jgi:hypothetical protein
VSAVVVEGIVGGVVAGDVVETTTDVGGAELSTTPAMVESGPMRSKLGHSVVEPKS